MAPATRAESHAGIVDAWARSSILRCDVSLLTNKRADTYKRYGYHKAKVDYEACPVGGTLERIGEEGPGDAPSAHLAM